jgi:hypothetical protein
MSDIPITTYLFWLQILNAAFLAFVFTQIAFMGHDAGHRQMFQSSRTDERCRRGGTDEPSGKHPPSVP